VNIARCLLGYGSVTTATAKPPSLDRARGVGTALVTRHYLITPDAVDHFYPNDTPLGLFAPTGSA
jgi:hypothetical protein